MATYGSWDFYRHDGALYPALLYAYWPIGVLLDGVDQARAIKGISIPFDLAIGVVVYLAARRLTGPGRALIAPAVYLVQPRRPAGRTGVGPGRRRRDARLSPRPAGAGRPSIRDWPVPSPSLALLIKPQFGLVLLPVAVVAILRGGRPTAVAPLVRAALGGAAAYVVVALPLRMDPISYVGRVIGAGKLQGDVIGQCGEHLGPLPRLQDPRWRPRLHRRRAAAAWPDCGPAAAAAPAGPADDPGGRGVRDLRLLLPADARPRALPVPGDGRAGTAGRRQLERPGGIPAPDRRLCGLDALRPGRHHAIHLLAVARGPGHAAGRPHLDLADPDRDRGDAGGPAAGLCRSR